MSKRSSSPVPEYRIGDLVWSPWSSVLWPAMISYDPRKAVYFRSSSSSSITHYHIQYFGIVAQRAWVPAKSIQPIRSINENGKAKPQKKNLWKDFDVAIDELKRANALDLKQRKLTFIFDYGGRVKTSAKKVGATKKKSRNDPAGSDVAAATAKHVTAATDGATQPMKEDPVPRIPSSSPPPPSSSHPAHNISPRSSASPYSLRHKIKLTQRKLNAIATCSPLSEVGNVAHDSLLVLADENGSGRGPGECVSVKCDGATSDVHIAKTIRGKDVTCKDSNLFFTPPDPPPPPLPSADVFSSCTDDLLTPPSTGSDTDTESLDVNLTLNSKSKKSSKLSEPVHPPSLPPPSLPPPPTPLQSLSQEVCGICDNPSVPGEHMVICKGQCLSSFHVDCLGLIVAPPFPFICDACIVSPSVCFVCKKPSTGSASSLVPCSHQSCSEKYHLSCARSCNNFKFDSTDTKSIILSCGLHNCAKCICADSPIGGPSQKLIQCVACPLSLHKETCLIAGCEVLSDKTMMCYRHLVLSRSIPQSLRHFNMNTCLDCGEHGSLVCCDFCSAAYHVTCLPDEEQSGCDQERWLCPNCACHDLPTYGSIVMVKCGAYRWWPAQIPMLSEVSDSFRNSKPTQCMFLVRFFSTNQYFWTHHGRVIMFTEECAVPKDSKSHRPVAENYVNAFQEALVALRERKLKIEESKPVKKESKSYVSIKRNRYLIPRPPVETETEPCKCTGESHCGPSSNCINRAIFTECSTGNCPAGPKCLNQRILHNQLVPTETFYTGNRGWGLRTKRRLVPGDFIVEYVGEVVDMATVQERLKKTQEASMSSFYFLTLERNLIIDARFKSNHARFINHSCDPNCETQKWTVNGETRIGIFAIKDIEEGTELTFDYQLDTLGNEKKACLCGAPNCSGFLGEKPKQGKLVSSQTLKKGSGAGSKRSKVSSVAKEHIKTKQRKSEAEGVGISSPLVNLTQNNKVMVWNGVQEYVMEDGFIVLPPPPSCLSPSRDKRITKFKDKKSKKKHKSGGKRKQDEIKKSESLSESELVDSHTAEPVKEGRGAVDQVAKESLLPFIDINRKRKAAPSIMKTAKQRKEDPYDDECFICGEGGDLVICDYQDCYKVYHLSCIGIKELPDGDFHCQRHLCCVCGEKTAEYHCFYCPRSYCEVHYNDKLQVTDSASFKCLESCNTSTTFEKH